MLRKMVIKKIIISSFALLSIMLLYFMPSNKDKVTLTTNVEYIFPDTLETIYLLDRNDYVARTEITTCNCDLVEKSKLLLEGIIIGVLAAGISILVVGSAYKIIATKLLESTVVQNLGITLVSFADMFNMIIIVYLILGIGIGVLGSSISMKKYLEV